MTLAKIIIAAWIASFLVGGVIGFIVVKVSILDKTYESTVCFQNRFFHCFIVEHAETKDKQERGLMGCEHLDRNRGMLFIFESESVRSFWMKGMLIPLDIVWLDKNGIVVYIVRDMQPCRTALCDSVVPDAKAKYVLEVNAGIAKEIGLTVGDRLTLL